MNKKFKIIVIYFACILILAIQKNQLVNSQTIWIIEVFMCLKHIFTKICLISDFRWYIIITTNFNKGAGISNWDTCSFIIIGHALYLDKK